MTKRFIFAVATSFALSAAVADTKYWRGTDATSPTLASVDANWSPSGAPAATDDVVLDSASSSNDLEWDLDHGVASWTQTADYAATVTFKSGRDGLCNKVQKYAVGELDAGGTDKWFKVTGNVSLLGGKWTHPLQPTFVEKDVACTNGVGIWRLLVKVGGTMEIGASAAIDVTANGFQPLLGPGHGVGACSHGSSHGGSGGLYTTQYLPKPCYGSVKYPVCHGSGCGNPMSGGGAVRLDVAGALTFNGAIHADARNLNNSSALPQYYTGSGGSVFITAASITGTGAVSANGGEVTVNGAGAGGRIAIKLTGSGADFSNFATNNLEVLGRVGPGVSGSPSQTAHSGTIYLETLAQEGKGLLWIRGTSVSDTVIDQARGTYPGTGFNDPADDYEFSEIRLDRRAMLSVFSNVVVKATKITGDGTGYCAFYGGKLQLPENYVWSNLTLRAFNHGTPFGFASGDSQTVNLGTNCVFRVDVPVTFSGDLHLMSGSKVHHSSGGSYKLDLTFENDLIIDKGAAIDVTACGYLCDKGYSMGSKSGLGVATDMDGGGSHGGLGRFSGTASCYGSVTEPLEHGAGGHQQSGSNGGGIVKLNVAGTLRVDGAVRADGQMHVYGTSGTGYTGGAGGSINIRTGKLKGTGSVEANGGKGQHASWGCGGGGRIAIRLSDGAASFEPTLRVFARGGEIASSRKTGGPGTVYLQTAAQGEGGGTLVVDNDGYTPEYGAAQIGQYVNCDGIHSVVITNCGSLRVSDSMTLAFTGDWRKTPNSVFTADAGTTVQATGSEPSYIGGSNTFCNFKCEVPGKTLRFGTADSLFTIPDGGKLTLTGSSEGMITLESAAAPALWPMALKYGSAMSIERVAVSRSDARYGDQDAVATNSRDDENNYRWTITGAVEPGLPIEWTGEESSDWGNAANWDLGRLPVDTDVITISPGRYSPKLSDHMTLNTLIVNGTLDLNEYNLTVTNDFTCSGTLTVKGTEQVRVGRNLDFAGATVAASPAKLIVGGSAAQSADFGGCAFRRIELGSGSGTVSVNGGCSVRELKIAACDAVSFASGVTVTVDELVVAGKTSSPYTQLTSAGGSWFLKVGVGAFVSGVAVANCNANGGLPVTADAPCSNQGGNQNWNFGSGAAAVWQGTVDGNFETAGNWSTLAVPGSSDRVVVPAGMTVLASTAPVSVRTLEVDGAFRVATNLAVAGAVVIRDGGVLTLDEPSTVGGQLMIRSGAKLTHSANSTKELYALNLQVSGNIEVEAGAKIDTTACGLSGFNGPGQSISCDSAASHGGRGGYWTMNGDKTKPCYDSVFAPVRVGSGGFHNSSWKAGGAVRISTPSTMCINGSVLADGDQDTLSSHYSGSGGSVWLTAAEFAGSGTVSAIGGRVTDGASAGGGRVALVRTTGAAWTDSLTTKAHGGPKITGVGIRSAPLGSAGTVYRELATQGAGRGIILIDNDGAAVNAKCAWTELPAAGEGSESAKELEHATVVLQNGAVLGLTSDLTIQELELLPDAGKTTANVKVLLRGHTLTIRSHRHVRGRGWPTNWNSGSSIIFEPGGTAEAPGKVLWKPYGMCIMLK